MVPSSEMIAFTIPAFAYVPSTHLVFHSLWQVGMSLGTVMTDSVCLPKVRLEKTTLAALLCSKKRRLNMSHPLRSTMNPPRCGKSLVYLIRASHQAIIKRSPASSPNLFISLSWKKAPVRFICHVSRKRWESEMGWTSGSRHGVFVTYLWQGEVARPGRRVVKNLLKVSDYESVSQSEKNIFQRKSTACIFFLQLQCFPPIM